MKLTYVSHACLLLEHAQHTVVTDPWFNGAAYLNQWHVFPKPADTSFTETATHILLTHGHEDHLHIPTLQLMNKNARVFFPYTWKDGTREILEELGFTRIEEVHSMKKIKLGEDFFATFIVNGLDAFVVYESEGKVMVNLNDALNAHHWSFVEMFTQTIRKNWKGVDLLICGLGGASYFPNTVHAPGKDDKEIAVLREQFLTHKFLEIAEEIKPKAILPFVPGFALLEKDKQWINEVKFPRNQLREYCKSYFPSLAQTEFYNLLPGDFIENEIWNKSSPYHAQAINDNVSHLVQEQYAHEIEKANTHETVSCKTVDELCKGLQKILPVSQSGIAHELLAQIDFVIAFKDVAEQKFIHCYFENNHVQAKVVSEIPSQINIRITTFTFRLKHAVEELWGGDVFYIGYGADIYILKSDCLKDNIDIVSLRLLSRFPSASHHIKLQPLRAAKYFSANPQYALLAIKQKMIMRGNMNKLPYNERSHWVEKGKCDVCRLCDIPLLSDEFGNELKNYGAEVLNI